MFEEVTSTNTYEKSSLLLYEDIEKGKKFRQKKMQAKN